MASGIEARANPELLIWARETAGFSAGVAAGRLKVPIDRLEAWEGGRHVPRCRSCARLPNCTGVPSQPSISRGRPLPRSPSTTFGASTGK